VQSRSSSRSFQEIYDTVLCNIPAMCNKLGKLAMELYKFYRLKSKCTRSEINIYTFVLRVAEMFSCSKNKIKIIYCRSDNWLHVIFLVNFSQYIIALYYYDINERKGDLSYTSDLSKVFWKQFSSILITFLEHAHAHLYQKCIL